MPTNYLAAVLLALLLAIGPRQAAATEAQGFAGSASCAQCHESETAAWRSSHHGWALREAGPESVLADFNDKTFSNKGVVSRFFRDGGKYMVETDGPDGSSGPMP